MSDPDGSGEIDLEEFKVALFAVDPDSGNPVGFTPNALLTPLDAFEVCQMGWGDKTRGEGVDSSVGLSMQVCRAIYCSCL